MNGKFGAENKGKPGLTAGGEREYSWAMSWLNSGVVGSLTGGELAGRISGPFCLRTEIFEPAHLMKLPLLSGIHDRGAVTGLVWRSGPASGRHEIG